MGILIPWIEYATINVTPIAPAGLILRLKNPNMRGTLIRRVQFALKSKGFDSGVVDGVYGTLKGSVAKFVFDERGIL